MIALQHKQKTNALPALLIVLSLLCFMKMTLSTRHYTSPVVVPNIWTPPTDSVIITP